MKTIPTPLGIRNACREVRHSGRTLGLVPTMGSLHEGHLSLVRRSGRECDATAVSLFVNPKQFGPGEDLEAYPRDLERDQALLEAEGVDLLFAPEAEDIYPPGHRTAVLVEGLSESLCGRHRPGHFRGVATIVAKLFNLVGPDRAYFGQKDYQQAVLLRRMALDLDCGLELVICPTVREPDGLALSSRNAYLTPEERRAAPALHAALAGARERAGSRLHSGEDLARYVREELSSTPFRIQYIEAVSAADLQLIDSLQGEIVLAAAAFLGRTRLIDNVLIQPQHPDAEETAQR